MKDKVLKQVKALNEASEAKLQPKPGPGMCLRMRMHMHMCTVIHLYSTLNNKNHER